MPDADVLIVGGGLAGANCARILREEGFEGSIVLAGREPDAPYHRPPCSKEILQGRQTRADALFRPAEWWDEQDIDLRTRTNVMSLDTARRVARLSSREELSFGQALIATGANIRRLNVEGSDLDGIHYLRTLGTAESLRADAEQAERVVCVGGSYIGTEVAASLTVLGKRCSIVMMEEVTLERPFGRQVGRFFQGVLEEHGIDVHGGQTLARLEGSDGRVRRVVCESGLELDADLVVIGAGARPDATLARTAGLDLGESGGVRCDSRLRTSAEGIVAAGDMCEYDSVVHGRRLRIEHWDVAFSQGRTAALNLLGRDVAHDVVPYFFSDLADWSSMEYVGPAAAWDEEVVRGSLEDGSFSLWYLAGGKVAAALSVGRSADLDAARRLISSGASVEPSALGDVDAELAEL